MSHDCPDCHDGYFFASKFGHSYVFRCALCHTQEAEGIPSIFLQRLIFEGYKLNWVHKGKTNLSRPDPKALAGGNGIEDEEIPF